MSPRIESAHAKSEGIINRNVSELFTFGLLRRSLAGKLPKINLKCLLPNQQGINIGLPLKKLEAPDSHNLNAAIGWLDLGNPMEALLDLERITQENRTHPGVLEVEWRIFATKKKWAEALDAARKLLQVTPDNPVAWINQSYSLHELKRTQEAWEALLPAATQFPEVSVIPYNLACYACQLGQLEVARQRLAAAIELAGKDEIKAMALADADLKPLWEFIRAL
jgi:predicted Zn-dependent protease